MLQLENLQGNVKSIYVTNENGFYLKIGFDTKGKITRKEEYRDQIIIWDNYEYDKEGRLISMNEFYPADSSRYKILFKYYNDGVRESYFEGINKNQRSYKYDKRGNCITEIFHFYDDEFEYKERIYNKNDQLIEAFSHNGPVRLNVWKTDIDGNTFEETKWTEPIRKNHVRFDYDNFGNVSLIILKTKDGYSLIDKNDTITYKLYDQAGNWLEKIMPIKLTEDGYNEYDIYNSYHDYFDIYETHLDGFKITRIIEYYD